jgi:hypothetical protein
LDSQDHTFILKTTEGIIEELSESQQDAKTPASATSILSLTGSSTIIYGCPAHDEAEELFVHMVGSLLQPQGFHLESLSTRTPVTEVVIRIKHEPPAVVFIATLPGGLPQARHLCRAVRRECPTLPIVVGYWGQKETFDRTLTYLRQAGATALTTSIQQTSNRIQMLAEEAVISPPAQIVTSVA